MRQQNEEKQQLKEKVKKIRKKRKELLSELNPILHLSLSYEEYRCFEYLKSFSITLKKSEVYIQVPIEENEENLVIEITPTKIEDKNFFTKNLDCFMKKWECTKLKFRLCTRKLKSFLKLSKTWKFIYLNICKLLF